MSDADPKSLLTLCDDILIQMLSFMPLKSRVRHSRTCTAMYKVMNDSLLTVSALEEADWFVTPGASEIKSRMKTLSKLRNLDTVFSCMMTGITEVSDEVIQTMVSNCHYVREIRNWDMGSVVQFVTGLVGKGVPVRLKMIEVIGGHELLLQMLKGITSASFSVRVDEMIVFPFVTDTEFWDRVVEVNAFEADSGFIPFDRMRNVKKLTGIFVYPENTDRMKQILQSLPQLTHIQVIVYEHLDLVLQGLTHAHQKFEEITIIMNCVSKSDVEHLNLMLESKGRELRSLDLTFHAVRGCGPETQTHVLDLIRSNCSRLMFFSFDYERVDRMSYAFNELHIYSWRELSLRHVLAIIPNVRVVQMRDYVKIATAIPDYIIDELREFASRKKKYCIIFDIGFLYGMRNDQISSSFDQNLLIRRRAMMP